MGRLLWEFIKKVLGETDFIKTIAVTAVIKISWVVFKDIPILIWDRINRYFLYTATIEESDGLYKYASKWILDRYSHKIKNSQYFLDEIPSGVYYDEYSNEYYDEETNESVSVTGKISKSSISEWFFIFYKGRYIKVDKEREKLTNSHSFKSTYMGRLTFSGLFAKKQIESLVNGFETLIPAKKEEDISIHRYDTKYGNSWISDKITLNKTIDQLFFEGKEVLLSGVENFVNSKDWYTSKGILYKYGILLYGPPGTAKTTAGLLLGKHLKRDVYVMSISGIDDTSFRTAFMRIQPNSILVLDDIDIGIKKRDEDTKGGVNLSTLLSCLDGTMSKHNVIVIMTTNRKELLDSAMIRKGRVDLCVEMGYARKKDIEDYLNFFFEEGVNIERETYDFSMVNVQDICMNSNTIQEAKRKIESYSSK